MPTPAAPPLAPRALLRWDVVRPIVARIAPRTVIEVGVGAGAMGARIAAMTSGSYVACEIDPTAFAQAKVRIERVGGVVHDQLLTDVDPEPADLVCAFEVLEHLEDDASALTEWAQYVRPGGTLLLSVPANPGRFGPMDVYSGHYRRYTAEGLRALAAEAGLVDVETHLYGAPLGYALEAVRNRIDARRLAKLDDTDPETMTPASGRSFQFDKRSWKSTVTEIGTFPFTRLQRIWPDGTGLVMAGRKPA